MKNLAFNHLQYHYHVLFSEYQSYIGGTTISGNKIGGLKARDKNLANDPDHYHKMGKLGGMKRHPNKGFGGKRELARIAGAKGGRISRRGNTNA